MFNTLVVAKAIQEFSEGRLTNLHLQKVLYLCHVAYLGLYDKPLIAEDFEAWVYGPVSPSLYKKVKAYGAKPVRYITNRETSELPEKVLAHIKEVVALIGHYKPYKLVAMTHDPRGGWAFCYDPDYLGLKIPLDKIKQEFGIHFVAKRVIGS